MSNKIQTSTLHHLPGCTITESCGIVFASAAHVPTSVSPGPDKEALKSLEEEAQKVGANAILALRFVERPSAVLAYGTAVKLVKETEREI